MSSIFIGKTVNPPEGGGRRALTEHSFLEIGKGYPLAHKIEKLGRKPASFFALKQIPF